MHAHTHHSSAYAAAAIERRQGHQRRKMPATITIRRLRAPPACLAWHCQSSQRRHSASHRTIRAAAAAAVVLGVVHGLIVSRRRRRSGWRHDAGAAKRARGVEPQPRADAVGVEPVAAAREEARRVAVAELHDAHRALGGLPVPAPPAFAFAATAGAAGVHVHGQRRRHVVHRLRAVVLAAAPLVAGRRPCPWGGHGQRRG